MGGRKGKGSADAQRYGTASHDFETVNVTGGNSVIGTKNNTNININATWQSKLEASLSHLPRELQEFAGEVALQQAFWFAIEHGIFKRVQKILSCKKNESLLSCRETKFSNAPLHAAASRGHPNIVKLIVSFQKSYPDLLEAKQKHDKTPLLVAAENGKTEIVEILINSGANLYAFDKDKNTALHLAARKGHTPTVEALVKLDGENRLLGQTNRRRDTPLSVTAAKGNKPCLEVLAAAEKASGHAMQDSAQASGSSGEPEDEDLGKRHAALLPELKSKLSAGNTR